MGALWIDSDGLIVSLLFGGAQSFTVGIIGGLIWVACGVDHRFVLMSCTARAAPENLTLWDSQIRRVSAKLSPEIDYFDAGSSNSTVVTEAKKGGERFRPNSKWSNINVS